VINLAPALLVAWLGLVVVLSLSPVPTRLAIIGAFVLGLLFLPMVGDRSGATEASPVAALALPGLTLSKYKVISLAVLLGLLVRDGAGVLPPRLSWVDLPMIAWLLCPLPSALMAPPPPDGSSAWKDGLSQCIGQFFLWGVPYFVGKRYLGSHRGLRELAAGLLLGGMLYVPLCLYEVRMSPQLHAAVYGFSQHDDFAQTIRFDGFRPMVFLQHGLAVGLLMASVTLLATWLWWADAFRYLPGSFWSRYASLARWLVLLLAAVTVLSKSTGALLLGAAGLAVLGCARLWKTPWPLIGLLALAPLYITARGTGIWSGSDLVPLLTEVLGQDRAESFECRQVNEDLLVGRALEGPPFGWCGWGRNLVHDSDGKNLTIPDGLWVITLGDRGVPGLVALYLALLLPVARFLWLQPAGTWSHPLCAPAAACAVIVVLFALDTLGNAMHNHVFILMAGALAGLPRGRDH
jgi:hypothetical protein